MVDALSGVSAVGPVNAGRALDFSQGASPLNAATGLDLAKAAATDLSSLELSRTGQLIESVMSVNLPQTDHTSLTSPLLPSPAVAGQASTLELAQSLHSSLSLSGLFYESHLADWVSGFRSQAQVLQEPQAKLTNEKTGLSSPGSDPTLTTLKQAEVSLASALPSGVHPQSIGILQHQLQAIDNQIIPWQGQIWPGQDLDWKIEPDSDPNAEHPQGASPIRWKSTLKLTLPMLGEIHAQLILGPQGCQISLISEAHQVAEIKNALPSLGMRLQDAGIRAEQLTVKPRLDEAQEQG